MTYDPNDTLRVYISCARADISFASELTTSLNTCGFDTRCAHNISSKQGKPTPSTSRAEFEDRISDSDTLLFILSPEALDDHGATSELEDAYNMGKRIYLIPIKQISSSEAPPALLKLPFVSFHNQTSFADSLSTLVSKLKNHLPWVKEHTHLARMAAKWNNHGKASALLLFGKELDRASSWLANKPEKSSQVTKLQDEYISESLKAYQKKSSKGTSAKFSKIGLLAMAASFCAIVYLGLQWKTHQTLNGELERQLTTLQQENQHLADVQTRLYSDVRLAPHSNKNGLLTQIPGWYPRAASHAGSVARITYPGQRDSNTSSQDFTGVLISGEMLGSAYTDKTYILTPTFNRVAKKSNDKFIAESDSNLRRNVNFHLATKRPSERVMLSKVETHPDANYHLKLPALHDKTNINAQKVIWQSQIKNGDQPAFSLHQITTTLPLGGRALSFGDLDCQKFSRIKSLGRQEEISINKRYDPIGIFSLAPIEKDYDDYSPFSSHGYATLEISNLASEGGLSHINYEQGSILPETGAPVFNLTTGKIIALHIGQSSTSEDYFEGVSLVSLLNEVRADLSVPASKLNSVCESY